MPRVLEKYNMKDLGSARAIKILMQENASLKNALPTAHISTTSIQLTDSAEDLPIEHVKIKGATSQESTNGYNLFDVGTVSDYKKSNGEIATTAIPSINGNVISIYIIGQGATYAYNTKKNYESGTYTITGKASGNYSRIFVRLRSSDDTAWLTNNDVTMSGWTYNSYYGGWYVEFNTTANINKTVTIPTCLYWQIGVGWQSSDVGETKTISELQLEEGSTAHDYEPYTGGQASPNPSYPQLIHRVTGECNEKVQNRNLLPNTQTTQIVNGVTFTINEKKSIKINGTANAQTSLRINTIGNELSLTSDTYTISTKTILPTGVSLQGWHSEANNFVTINSGNNKASFTLANDVTNVRFQIVVTNGAQINNATIYPVLETGSTAHDFEPHAEQNAPLTLGNLEAYEGDEIEIDYVQKAGYKKVTGARLVQNKSKLILDGTEDWYINSGVFNIRSLEYVSTELDVINVFCDTYKAVGNVNSSINAYNRGNNTICELNDNSTSRLFIRDDRFSTVNDFKANLQINNVTLIYEPITATTTEITDPTLLAQFETLINMKTYKNITNIESTGADLAPVLDCDYYQDMSTLNDRLDELEARIELLEE